ncbi:MAG: hypothetical protein BWK77_08925 [Verrucomicrobia bacterium A1]|nr:MAG: hypothetical protein BWK77_08925 [Verrucomicrobia bacterium A1]
MNSYVLDASVAAAWYLEESFSPAARAWQERMLEGRVRLVVPGLHFWEMGNIFRKLAMRRILDETTARELFDLHMDASLERIDPDPRAVLRRAFEFGATMNDAVYIALALDHDLRLLTAERSTTGWVARMAKRVELVR